jgi:hypothetical protein
VAVDLEVCPAAELIEQRLDAAILELDNRAAIGADQVVMVPVGRAAEEVRVAAVRLVQPVKDAVLDEKIEGAEDGRATNSGVTLCQTLQQLVCGKRPIVFLDRVNDGTAWPGESVAGIL